MLHMSRSLLPLHTRSVKMESRTPRTAIFDPLLICLEGFQDAQKVDALFVCVRLSLSESLALLPELLPLFHYGKSITAVFGIESGFSLGAEGGYGIDCAWLFVAVLPAAPGAGSCLPTSVIVH